jgi:alanine racemase
MNFHSKAIVHLGHFHRNFQSITDFVGNNVSIIPVIKADGYGHGMIRIARELQNYNNVGYLGVAHIKEGVILRKNGIKQDVLAMSCLDSFDVEMMDEFDITPVVHSLFLLKKVADYAKMHNKKIKIHLKFDTGMARLGIRKEDIEESILLCKKERDYIEVDGLMSHFSDSESDASWTLNQNRRFMEIVNFAKDEGFNPAYKHIANSGAVLQHRQTHHNCIRPGLIMYGYTPSSALEGIINIKPVMEIKSQLISIHSLKKGEGISYGRTFTAPKDMRIGVVAFGYADGLFRSLSNRLECLINGRRCKSVGTICMDMFMCDITDIEASVSDEAVIVGRDNNEEITINDLAGLSGTINYEILTNIGKSIRVNRMYVD